MKLRVPLPIACALVCWGLVVDGPHAGHERPGRWVQTPGVAGEVKVRETVLARLDPGAHQRTLAVDPHTIRRVSWVSGVKGAQRMYVDGASGPLFDEVYSTSTDCEPGSNTLVWWYPTAQDCPSSFSRDGSRVSYSAKRKRFFVVVDGVEHGSNDRAGVTFSPDGRRALWQSTAGRRTSIAIDGSVYGPIERQPFPFYLRRPTTFSPDSRRWAIPGRMREGGRTVARMIVDGVNGPPFRMVGNPHFSTDGRHVAYWAHAEGQRGLQLIVNDAPVAQTTKASPELLETLDNILSDSGLPFAPDEARLAFAAERGGKLVAVVHGKEGPPCDWISPMAFSADYTRSAYVIGLRRNPVSSFVAWAKGSDPDFQYRLVMDGAEQTAAASPSPNPMILSPDGRHLPVYLSPDGRHVGYATDGDVVVDGAGTLRGGEDGAFNPAFSPDGARVACSVWRGGKTWVRIDGIDSVPVSDGLRVMRVAGSRTMLAFSPDGRHVVYVVSHRTGESLGIDLGLRSPVYDEVVGGMIVFDTPSIVAFAARRGRDVLRVEVDLASVPSPALAR